MHVNCTQSEKWRTLWPFQSRVATCNTGNAIQEILHSENAPLPSSPLLSPPLPSSSEVDQILWKATAGTGKKIPFVVYDTAGLDAAVEVWQMPFSSTRPRCVAGVVQHFSSGRRGEWIVYEVCYLGLEIMHVTTTSAGGWGRQLMCCTSGLLIYVCDCLRYVLRGLIWTCRTQWQSAWWLRGWLTCTWETLWTRWGRDNLLSQTLHQLPSLQCRETDLEDYILW